MAHTKSAARKLATQAEMPLLESSFGPALKDITLGRLKQKITKSRKLQDKYRDLAKQQRGEARGKHQAKSTRPARGNGNTVTKQEMFSEALARFEAQLEKLEAKAAKELARKEKAAEKKAKASAKKTAKTATKKSARKVAKKSARKTGAATKRAARKATSTARKAVSSSSRFARKSAKVSRGGSTKHQAHVGSRGRRRQGKRDSR